MLNRSLLTAVTVSSFVASASMGGLASAQAPREDAKGCSDNPMFTRMPDSYIYHCSEQGFAAYDFLKGTPRATTVEGHLWKMIDYPQPKQGAKPSDLQILRNFENAAAQIGAEILPSPKGRAAFRLKQDGRERYGGEPRYSHEALGRTGDGCSPVAGQDPWDRGALTEGVWERAPCTRRVQRQRLRPGEKSTRRAGEAIGNR